MRSEYKALTTQAQVKKKKLFLENEFLIKRILLRDQISRSKRIFIGIEKHL